jgi:hypothetical protein
MTQQCKIFGSVLYHWANGFSSQSAARQVIENLNHLTIKYRCYWEHLTGLPCRYVVRTWFSPQ